jgi:hypothetical protein
MFVSGGGQFVYVLTFLDNLILLSSFLDNQSIISFHGGKYILFILVYIWIILGDTRG